jgi:hypothetical protein
MINDNNTVIDDAVMRNTFESIYGPEPLDRVSTNSLWNYKFTLFCEGWRAEAAHIKEAQ